MNNVIGPDQVNAGAFPVLFGTNEAFKKQIWRGAIERLLAAFLLVKKKLALGLYGSDMERSQMEISQETIRSRLQDLPELQHTSEFNRLIADIDVD